jgi:lysozyme family protein
MIRKLFSRLVSTGKRAERVASVAPYVKETAKTSHDAPAMSEKPPIVPEPVAKAPTIKAANEAINALPPITHPDRFPACLKVVLKHEGGYVNHPRDPGGRTNLGVTQRVWEDWSGKPANEAIMRDLTVPMVAPLYRAKYWNKVRGPDLPPGLDLHVFDFGVNAGPARAIRYLQIMVGTNPDGKFGPATKRALSNYLDQYGTAKAIRRYGELREQYYRSLRTFATFGRGWLRRNREVTAAALEMGA